MKAPSERPDRIVAGIDGSGCSRLVLQTAAAVAAALKLNLQVISCWSRQDFLFASQFPGGRFPDPDLVEREASHLVNDTIKRAFGPNRPPGLTVRIRYGHPAAVLIEESANARMLVVGRRGRGGFNGLPIGSVASACTAYAHCPVVVVNDPDQDGFNRS
ncbi:universal stress protein [Arthrobacter sp. AQ5-05]|uniref:universal stress protein n=1 Tax=Arthrobacter sp. AQ5-05 TaxID=2184581 RepID=UPI000DCF1038|nr:universal stress protein [Arthrobacter sp. AQ5-05]RAX48655.1 universal stress protein [Arthrobacter sp. AQ5-05]